jgi:fatty acid desaturase
MGTTPAPPPDVVAAANEDIPIALKWSLVDDRGTPYREFRRTLTPRYWLIWLHIGAGYVVLVGSVAALVAWAPPLPVGLAFAALGALVIGYALAYLNNFFHEATHYNLLPRRRVNDLATNLLMGWLFGSSISTYRKIHFQHHRALGTTQDSENSYFDPLRIRYLVEGLFGLKVIRTLRRYRQTEKRREDRGGDQERRALDRSRLLWLLVAAIANLALAALLWVLGSPAAALAWVGGVVLAFPFFVSLRQLLEHRSEHASPVIDYTHVDHGAVNRLFGDGPVADTLGSAGFSRHALHHWEPTLSYTRLKDLERYLLRSPARDAVVRRQTSYRETFLRLLEL